MPSLGFGIEKLGLAVIRAPIVALIIIVILSGLCALGIPKLKTHGTLSELFRSTTTEFQNYAEMSKRFPTSEFDILIVVEDENIMNPELLEEIRTTHLELQFSEAVSGVISLFSMRERPNEKGYAAPMLPAEFPEGEEFEKLASRVANHPLVTGKLLSKRSGGSQLTLIVLSLKPDIVAQKGLETTVDEIRETVNETLGETKAKVQLAGVPIMRLEIRNAIKRDRLIYNTVGFIVGFIICLAFFRRPMLVFIASICPALSVLWALGILGHLDQRLTTFINVIPPLVMVIAFTDAMHMVFSIRRRLRQGDDRFKAVKHAVKTVGPACVLTSLTTSIAMLSLTLTDSGLIRTFGYSAALATLLAFVSVIMIVPMLSVLLIRNEEKFVKEEVTRSVAIDWLGRGCTSLADWLRTRHIPIAVLGLVLVSIFIAAHLQLEPRYRLSDQVPDSKQSRFAAERLDAKLTGAYPVHIMIRWPKTKTISSQDVINAIAESHTLLERQPNIGNVWSLDTLARWLKENVGDASPEIIIDYLEKLPKHLTMRFVNSEDRAALATGRVPNLDADQSVPVMRAVDAQLNRLRSKYRDLEFTVTGLAAVSALQSTNMIGQLNRGLIAAVAIVIVLIGVAFRSGKAALLSIFPNLFPIVAAGTLLYLGGDGLEYASVIALTVAFGLAVDDTIHFLNRLHIEQGRTPSTAEAVYQTIGRLGPVLVLTTIVLVLGLAVTVISELPAMRLFGKLFVTTLTAALVGDLLVLPAIILSLRKLGLVKKEA